MTLHTQTYATTQHIHYGVCITCGAILTQHIDGTLVFRLNAPGILELAGRFPELYAELSDLSRRARHASSFVFVSDDQLARFDLPLERLTTHDNHSPAPRVHPPRPAVSFLRRLASLIRGLSLWKRPPWTTTARAGSPRRVAR